MPFPRSQLDAYLVFVEDNITLVKRIEIQKRRWVEAGYLSPQYKPTLEGRDYFGLSDFLSVQSVSFPTKQLFANHQGGYRVFCPVTDRLVTSDFVQGIQRWRGTLQDSDFYLVCSQCQKRHPLDEVYGKPSFAFGWHALRFVRIGQATPSQKLLEDLQLGVGRFKLVLSRVG